MRLAALALLLAAAPALAQTAPAPAPAPMRHGGGGMGGMMRADTNHDGTITRAEATAQADAMFDRMDTNRDGRLTADEMTAWHDRMQAQRGGDAAVPPPGGPRHAPGMGRKADPNGDGVITREEFRARAMTRFDRMDANHDGVIDKTELANLREMRMERRDDGATPPAMPQQ